jgi:hypothetical protein
LINNGPVILSGAGALFAPAQSKDLRLLVVHALTDTAQFQALRTNPYVDTAWVSDRLFLYQLWVPLDKEESNPFGTWETAAHSPAKKHIRLCRSIAFQGAP